ncbi:mitogen-activated protein kinase kinase kinase 3-like [Physella acuta]|uniref:mitogen-activated protein kinase kinase kinase 3-like n=1 Tax=Physella acuta TaxID=109671 RepID=UPI0027DD0189|nr:mitogen-activated protein kinase kinase kinase 3-like [Physella acuta]
MENQCDDVLVSLAPEFPKHWISQKLIDNGSFGQVFVVQDTNNPDEEKFIGKEISLSEVKMDKAANFVELDIMMKIKHPRIISFYGYEKNASKLTLFFEYISLGSVKDCVDNNGPLPEEKIKLYTKQILEGLKYLHERNPPIIHRDIKGENVLLKDEMNIKLTDFGLSKIVHSATQARTVAGTYNWMAPEVVSAKNKIPYDYKVDIWSLGCTVVEMATRRPPFPDLTPAKVIKALTESREPTYTLPKSASEQMRNFLELTLQINPHDRPSTAELISHSFFS